MRFFLCLGLLASLSIPVHAAVEPLVLSEFLANNTSGLKDEDGAFSDWIEIQNRSASPVSIGGWHLSDNAANLTKWRFPSTNIPPNGFLLVFASGKNRVQPGGPLHTNFKLDAAAPGEYLGLILPDGVTVASQFAPTYPTQFPDISYGFGVDLLLSGLVASNSAARYWVPTSDILGDSWKLPSFSADTWKTSVGSLGYDTGVADPAEDNQASEVMASAPLAYYRFDSASGAVVENLGSLGSDVAAQLVGSASLRGPGPRPPSFKGFEDTNLAFTPGAAGDLRLPLVPAFNFGAGPFSVEFWFFTTNPIPRGDLFTYKGPGGDFGIQLSSQTARRLSVFHNAFLGGGGTVATSVWNHVVVARDQTNGLRAYLNGIRVVNTVDSASMNSGGDPVFGSNHTGDPAFPSIVFNGSIDEVALYDRALSTNEIVGHFKAAQNPTPVSYLSSIDTDVQSSVKGVNSSVYFRYSFTATQVAGIDRLKLRLRYDDGFVAYLNGVEVAAANAPESTSWSSAALARHPDSLSLRFEEFDLNSSRDLLVEGLNVLAIQGLNIDANNADFLLQAELLATSIGDVSSQARYFSTPSPGELNGLGTSDLGPIISEPIHSPARPRNEDDLLITARVIPTVSPVTQVTVRYRVMYQATNTLALLDDGLHGDGVAGDGVFGGWIPASASTNGQMIRWFFTASDAEGRSSRWPIFDDPTGSPEYLGTVVSNPALTHAIPVFEWFSASEASARTRNGARGSLLYGGKFYDNVYFRERGGATTLGSQKIDFNDGDEFELNESYRGIREANLNSNGSDSSFVRPPLAFETYRTAGNPGCLTVHMLMRANGKQDRGDGRADRTVAIFVEQVDSRYLKRNGLDPEGVLYKFVQRGSLDPVFSDSTDGIEKKTHKLERNTDLQALVDGIKLTRTPEQRAQYLFDNMNMPELINFLAVRCLLMDADDVRKNFYMYRDSGGNGEWWILPWDKDWTFGVEGDGAPYLHHPFFGDKAHSKSNADQWNVLWTVIFNDPRPREMYLRRLRSLMDDLLQPISTPASPSWMEQHARAWSTNLAQVLPSASLTEVLNYFPLRRDDLYRKYNVSGGGPASDALIPFAQPTSVNVVFGDMDYSPVSGDQQQEYVQLINPNSFAVDMTGWELSGGIGFRFHPGTVVPANSALYLSPNVVAFRARSKGPTGGQALFVQGNYSGQLSARGETLRLMDRYGRVVATTNTPANPTQAQQGMEITEIMYHPSSAPSGSPFTRDDFEYVELTFNGPATLELSGLRFTRGIDFDFTTSSIPRLPFPGDASADRRVILVKNRAAFESRYGASSRIAGQYQGTLSDQGETLRLEDAVGEVIAEFSYRDDWYPVTDGAGLALTKIIPGDLQFGPGDAAYWQPTSSEAHRPGGVPDTVTQRPSQVYVNEVLTHPAPGGRQRVELWAPLASDLSGWFLTDDLQDPKKYRLPTGTLIASGGFLVLDETAFHGGPRAFLFDANAGEVYLVAATPAGQILPWVDGFHYGGSDVGISFGRVGATGGVLRIFATAAPTFGAVNAKPRVGPLVFTELMFHPPDLVEGVHDSLNEFIEIRNLSAVAVPLYDPDHATNAWRIAGDVNLLFPEGLSLAGGSRLLAVPFDPAASGSVADAFRQHYQVAADVPLIGPYVGNFNNGNGSLTLLKPAAPSSNSVPFITVDQMEYSDLLPGAAEADGTGASLQRLVDTDLGNDSANWVAALPSPGIGLTPGPSPIITLNPSSDTVPGSLRWSLDVSATSTTSISYRWRFQGRPLPEGTNATLVLPSVQAYQAGVYDVVVYNGSGATLSLPATLSVDIPTQVLLAPSSINSPPGSNVTFRIVASSARPLTYRWFKDELPLAGATNSFLQLTGVQFADAGTYRVQLHEVGGASFLIPPATLRILVKPSFLSLPQSMTAVVGETVRFSVAVSGQPLPMVYRWRKASSIVATLTNNSQIGSLVLSNVQFGQAGKYSVIVTNLAGATAASADVSLTVLADFDQDGLPDLWEAQYGFNTNSVNEALIDSDGDGMNNRAEWMAGTDPLDSHSVFRLAAARSESGVTTLSFQAVSNHTYSLVLRDPSDLTSSVTVSNIAASSADRAVEIADLLPSTRTRYYQAITPAGPDTRGLGPQILEAPDSVRVEAGRPFSLAVIAVGQGALRYQWSLDDVPLADETRASLSRTKAGIGESGSYRVVITDSRGKATSSASVEVWQ